jgi:amino acid adenylation domain-containing protein
MSVNQIALYSGIELSNQLENQCVQSQSNQNGYVQNLLIHQLFEAQVERFPQEVAVVFGTSKLTYQALNSRANQLARYLRSVGVGPEVKVGLCVQPSLELAVGLLGILKAGGVYVPLDPTYPQERLTLIFDQSQIAVLLTQQHLIDNLPPYSGPSICLDSNWESFASLEDTNLGNQVSPHHAAYIVYTSGTTGYPKGVVAEHGNLRNYILATQQRFQFDHQDAFPCIARFSFSISLFELLSPLVVGGKAVIFTRDNVLDIAYLVSQLEHLTNLHTVPSLMRQIVNFLQENPLAATQHNLKRVFIGGDAIPLNLMEEMKTVFKGAEIYVLYGCSEVTTLCLSYKVPTDTTFDKRIVGKPFNNVSVRLYDEQQLVSVGGKGEIYIGGYGVTRGYLNQPEMTAQKFVTIDNQRFCKTGDWGRYLPDGNIEFIGRGDFQIKIRGIRIELGEIESALVQHPQVQQAVVIAGDDVGDERQLIAYVVTTTATTASELRTYLRGKLPLEMIPKVFVGMDSLPLNPNGKLDRRSLPVPTDAIRLPESISLAPRDEVEKQLANIWEKVLGIQPIGVKDNYFDLGGNSLQALHLFAQIDRKFGKQLPLSTLLKAPTVEALAHIIQKPETPAALSENEVSWSSLVPIQPHGDKPPLFCIHPAGGNILSYQELFVHLDPNLRVYALQARGLDGKQPPHTRVEDMASDYIKQIQTIQPTGPYFLGGHSFGGLVAYEMAQQLLQQGEKIGLLFVIDTSAPNAEQRLPFNQRIHLHLEQLSQQGLTYIRHKLKGWTRWQTQMFHDRLQKIATQCYWSLGLTLPRDLHSLQMGNASAQASAAYEMKAYPGKLTLFLVDDKIRVEGEGFHYAPNLGWDPLVPSGLDVHFVPGDHNSLLEAPHVQVLAEKLQACLDNAIAASLP